MAFGAPVKTPSCMRQAVCAYWEMRLPGSIARADVAGKSSNRRQTATARAMFAFFTSARGHRTLLLQGTLAPVQPDSLGRVNMAGLRKDGGGYYATLKQRRRNYADE